MSDYLNPTLLNPTLLTPQAPDLEEITLREITFGFVGGGTQDITLYPEDIYRVSESGVVSIEFRSMEVKGLPAPTFEAVRSNIAWKSNRYVRHRRVKGTLRPTPEEVTSRFKQAQGRESKARLQARLEQLAQEGLVGSDYDPNA